MNLLEVTSTNTSVKSNPLFFIYKTPKQTVLFRYFDDDYDDGDDHYHLHHYHHCYCHYYYTHYKAF